MFHVGCSRHVSLAVSRSSSPLGLNPGLAESRAADHRGRTRNIEIGLVGDQGSYFFRPAPITKWFLPTFCHLTARRASCLQLRDVPI